MDRNRAEAFAAEMRRKINEKRFVADEIDTILADEVVMYTPRFWRPITNRLWMRAILEMVPQAVENFTYQRHWIDGSEVFMEFTGNVGKLGLQGLDIFTLNSEGKVTELTVMIRPPNALAALGEVEDRMLVEMTGVASQDEFAVEKSSS